MTDHSDRHEQREESRKAIRKARATRAKNLQIAATARGEARQQWFQEKHGYITAILEALIHTAVIESSPNGPKILVLPTDEKTKHLLEQHYKNALATRQLTASGHEKEAAGWLQTVANTTGLRRGSPFSLRRCKTQQFSAEKLLELCRQLEVIPPEELERSGSHGAQTELGI